MFTFVEEGTTNADSGWVMTNDGAITVGTTALTFALFSVAGTIFAGDGLSKSGDVLNVNVAGSGGIEISSDNLQIEIDPGVSGLTTTGSGLALASNVAGDGITFTTGVLSLSTSTGGAGLTYTSGVLAVGAGDGITVNANDVTLASTTAGAGLTYTSGVLSSDAADLAAGAVSGGVTGTLVIAQGGTNATTEAAARDNLAATSASGLTTSTPTLARVASDTIGDGSATAFVITHNLGTRDVVIQVYDAASYDTVIADVVRTSTDTATVTFSSAPASNAYVAVITG
jgi:hypothetical protein